LLKSGIKFGIFKIPRGEKVPMAKIRLIPVSTKKVLVVEVSDFNGFKNFLKGFLKIRQLKH
jgi:hypothetical protein